MLSYSPLPHLDAYYNLGSWFVPHPPLCVLSLHVGKLVYTEEAVFVPGMNGCMWRAESQGD